MNKNKQTKNQAAEKPNAYLYSSAKGYIINRDALSIAYNQSAHTGKAPQLSDALPLKLLMPS